MCFSILAVAALIGVAPSAAPCAGRAPGRPNVVLIVTDDQGYGDFGATGNEVIETPSIDAMAARSASFANFYVSPVCAPTRASLMTGRYNYRTRVIDTYLGRAMMEPDEITVAELLSAAGYATGIFGKWHLGDNYPMRPMDQGFHESLVHRGGGLAQPSEPPENQGRYTNPILFRNGRQVETEGYCTDVYFDAALDFIQRAHADGRNFFTYIATNAPHGPFDDVPPALLEHYRIKDLSGLFTDSLSGKRLADETETLARIAAMITNIDENVGRLLRKLDGLGIANETLVMFMIDNGPSTPRYVRGLRGMKGTVYEGGIRSPLWLHWPGRLAAGRIGDQVAAHIDVMPTILDACQVPPPENLRLDGRSLLPILERDDVEWPERNIVIQSHRGDVPVLYHNFMIRDARWKLVHAGGFGRESFEGQPKFELYDLQTDPGEKTNLAAANPEIVARLKASYDDWFTDVSTTRPDNYRPPRIRIGTPHEEPTVLTRQDWRGGTWDRDSIGHWELDVATGSDCDITVFFEASGTAETAHLSIAGNDLRQEVAAGDNSCEFSAVPLRQGATRLAVKLDASGKSRGAHQVVVTGRK